MYKIMIIEDDDVMRQELTVLLRNNGYNVQYITDFYEVTEQIIKSNSDLILLDINLPNENGYNICSKIRASIETPVIFLTSKNSDMDELNGFISGGDDFIMKPYNIAVFLARIAALLKRTNNDTSEEILSYKGLTIFLEKNIVMHKEQEIEFSKNEFKILWFLIKGKGKILSRTEIIEFLWDNEMFVDDNTLSVNITRIRNKLKQIGVTDYIYTKHGQGYSV